MDEGDVDSDCSEDYFSASEGLKTPKTKLIDGGVGLCASTSSSSSRKYPPVRTSIPADGSGGRRPPSHGEDDISTKKKRSRDRERTKSATRTSPVIKHALNGMNTLYVLWANEKLCNVQVEVNNVTFPAHSVVLATHSDFFLRLLLKEEAAVASTHREIALGSLVTASGFGRILNYMYTSEIQLSWGTVSDTLQAALALEVNPIVQLGREFLKKYTIDNCLSAMKVIQQVGLDSLSASIRTFVLDNFTAVSRTEDYLKCPAETLARLLADDSLNVESETDILTAARRWIVGNGQDGIKHARLIMGQIRFHHIPPEDLVRHVESDETLMKIPEVKAMVSVAKGQKPTVATACQRIRSTSSERFTDGIESFLVSASKSDERLQMDEDSDKMQKAEPSHQSRTLAESPATTGSFKKPSCRDQPQQTESGLQSHVASADWIRLEEEPAESKKKSIETKTSLSLSQQTPRRSIQAMTGKQKGSTSPKARAMSPAPWPMPPMRDKSSLNPQTTTTPTIPSVLTKRFRAPRLTSDYRITASNPKSLISGPIAWPVANILERNQRPDVIVTVGGVAKSGESEVTGRMVEAFLLDKNEWRELQRMPKARNHHVVHFLNGFIYVLGGSDPHSEGDDFLKPVSSVLRYDVRAGEWSQVRPMNTARIFHEVTALFGQLYVVGGQDQTGCTLATVECYTPTTDTWRFVAPLPSARYGVAVTVYRGRIWVAGGFPEEDLAESSTIPRDVVCYNPFCDKWETMTPLRVPRCHTSLVEMAERLYMIGGFVGDSSTAEEKGQSMSTIETFNESRGTWEFVADLWQGRHDANTVTVGDKAYIIGGMEDGNEDPLPNVECFDPVALSWAKGLAPLSSPRFGHACCVVPGDVVIKLAEP